MLRCFKHGSRKIRLVSPLNPLENSNAKFWVADGYLCEYCLEEYVKELDNQENYGTMVPEQGDSE